VLYQGAVRDAKFVLLQSSFEAMNRAPGGLVRAALKTIFLMVMWGHMGSHGQPTPQLFVPSSDPAFADFREPLVTYLRAKGPRNLNTVCLIGERYPDGSAWVWAIWDEGQRMVLWEGAEATMTGSRRDLDLRRDVVANEAAVGGSTYRVSRAYVTQLRSQCAKTGTTVQLRRGDVMGGQTK
jgi:hypothetical protein